MKRTLPITFAFGLALVSHYSQAQAPEAIVEVAAVTEQSASSVVLLPGTLISTRDANIAAELSGRLTWVAQVGERVEEGQPLAHIDDHLLQLQLRNDAAEIARLDADIQYNRRHIQRLQKLAVQNNMARSELDEVESRLAMLLQEQRIAEVGRDRTLYDLERAQVRAPFSGVVVSRELTAGEYSTPGAPLLRLVDTSSVEVSVNAPLRVASFNREGARVEVSTGDVRRSAVIRGMVPVGDDRSRMMELRLTVEQDQWMIGEAVTVELPDAAEVPAITVPRDALVLRDNDVFVYTLADDSTAVRVPVRTLAGNGSRIAVEGELAAGDAVIVRGAERLREGQSVKVLSQGIAAN